MGHGSQQDLFPSYTESQAIGWTRTRVIRSLTLLIFVGYLSLVLLGHQQGLVHTIQNVLRVPALLSKTAPTTVSLPDLYEASILELQAGLDAGDFTSVHLVKAWSHLSLFFPRMSRS
jgi:hypothetical protein